jgi:hypothetical protein
MFIFRRQVNVALIGVVLFGAAATADSEELPVYAKASKDRMSMSIEVSRTGSIKAHRKATIKIPEGSLRHVFWFALLGESDNTLWVAPVETLTVAAKVHSGNEDFGEPIDSFLEETGHYELEKDVAKMVRGALIYMQQESFGDDLLKRTEEAVEQFKRVDNAYQEQKNSEIVKDGQKVLASGEK